MTTPANPTPHGLLVVGGGPAAHSAAIAYRDAGGTGSIVLLSDDTKAPYRRPPLSKGYLRGEVDLDDMGVGDDALAEKDVTVVLGATVVELDTIARTVRTEAGDTYAYAACVLATGVAPARLPVPGGDDERVHVLRSLADADAVRAASGTTAVVIGSGFVGCEAAVSLAMTGTTVTQVSDEALPQLGRLGADVGRAIAGWLTEAGITLVGGATVTAVQDGRTVQVEGRGPLEADLVLAAVGSTPRGQLADTAGLDVHGGRVVTDEHLATSAPGVWAAGDVAYARNATAGRHLAVEHWFDATTMGAIAGANAAGGTAVWDSVPGFFSGIGEHTINYAAWGDGWDSARFVDHGEGSFTAWYGQDGVTVGVLTHRADEDLERGKELVRTGAPLPD